MHGHHVLFREMPDAMILAGCRKIMERGMTLRTEQILAVPFSSDESDLSTLELNRLINPTHVWASILSPYPFVNIGDIAGRFGMHGGNEDDLNTSFFESSVLRHIAGGSAGIEQIVANLPKGHSREPLLRMRAVATEGLRADILYEPDHRERLRGIQPGKVGELTYLSERENARYCEQVARLHRLFAWLPRLPEGEVLGKEMTCVPDPQWSWETIGRLTTSHLTRHRPGKLEAWAAQLAHEMGYASTAELPLPIRQNPGYFTHFAAGGTLAKTMLEAGVFSQGRSIGDTLSGVNNHTRWHVFPYELYKIEQGSERIAH